MPGKIILNPHITRADLRLHPEILFVFGDNIQRKGLEDQAKEMRGEPNAVGIPIKWSPHIDFINNDLQNDRVRNQINDAFNRLVNHLTMDGTVVFPAHGIGTDRDQLEQCAPHILKYIEDHVIKLCRIIEFKEKI